MIKVFTKSTNEGKAKKKLSGIFQHESIKFFTWSDTNEKMKGQTILPLSKSKLGILESMFNGVCKGDVFVIWETDEEIIDQAYELLKNYIGRVNHGDGFITFTITRSPYEIPTRDKEYRQHPDNKYNV